MEITVVLSDHTAQVLFFLCVWVLFYSKWLNKDLKSSQFMIKRRINMCQYRQRNRLNSKESFHSSLADICSCFNQNLIWFRSRLRSWFVIHLIQIKTSKLVHDSFDSDQDFEACSWFIWFRSRLRSGFVNHLIQIKTSKLVRESFDSDQDFEAGSWIIWFRSRLRTGSWFIWFRSRLRSWFVIHLIQIKTSKLVRDSFDSDQDFEAGSWFI